ncbi:peptidase [Brenneria alni]|uniref:Peptidase n=1 Tax=Brenneria alni TaxID=71656 RepID=A0A421DJQ7_9GAMM|nr:TolC family outer membrane protein [Brenneria alni]RLM19008.1 peptidase [Brenneria alni]
MVQQRLYEVIIRHCRLLFCLFSGYCSSVSALGLIDAWQRAIMHDPGFQAARHERNAGVEERNIGRAALLPKVSYDYHHARIDSTVTSDNRRADRDYASHASTLSLQQPLLDYEAWSRYQRGNASALLADEQLRNKSQQLLVKLFQAYSDVLFSQEQIILIQAQQRSWHEQLKLNRRLFEMGEGTRTDILETEARLNLSEAQLIEAKDNLDFSEQTLAKLLGMAISAGQLAQLNHRLAPYPLQPANLQHWQALALRHNAQLLVLGQSLAVARYDIERNRAGHLPRITLVANARKTSSETESSYNQKYDTRSIGFQVSIPLFSGGGVSAATRQATERYLQAAQEKDEQTSSLLIELRRQFNLVISSQAKIKAYQLAEHSALTLVQATKKSVLGGERVNLDILNAEQQLYRTRRDLTEARYVWLTAWLQLHYYAGTLDENILQQLANYFD